MKMWKSKKALSPVVASIILIAVTVAVSIAVAAWMASLTTGQMATEQIIFTGYSWGSPGTTVPYILISVKNNGAADLSIADVRVDGTATGVTTTIVGGGSFPYALAKGSSVTLNVTITSPTNGFTRGNQYSFTVLTSKGNIFGPYVQTAP